MQITVLGGAGGMGGRAVKDLAAQKDVSSIVIADLNVEAARKLAGDLNEKLGTEKVKAVKADATVPETIAAAISGSKAVAAAIGPYYKFGRMVVETAIEAGVHIVDICDDYDAVQGILSLHEKAAGKGVTVLTGMGWTPGLSNMLAVQGIQEMDKAEEVNIYWAGSAAQDSGYAVILHTLHIYTGMIPTFKDGKLINIAAGSGAEKVKFHDLGAYTVFHLGHPEPITMGFNIPGLSKVALKGGLTLEFLNKLTLYLCRSGLSKSRKSKDRIAGIVKKLLPLLERFVKNEETRSAIKVEVNGWKNGKEARVTYESNADMADLTGIPLAIGTLMLARKQPVKAGVFAPEALIDGEEFLAEFAARGMIVHKTS